MLLTPCFGGFGGLLLTPKGSQGRVPGCVVAVGRMGQAADSPAFIAWALTGPGAANRLDGLHHPSTARFARVGR